MPALPALRACLIATLVTIDAAAASQTAQQPPQPPPAPQEPTTSVVGSEGKLVSLIFLPADAANVTRRIYVSLLDRQPDAESFAASVAELQKGQLSQRLATIVKSPEFIDRATMHTPTEMVQQIFTGMFDRAPTAAEIKTYLPQVQARQYEPAMMKLITSSTFRAQAARDRAANPSAPSTTSVAAPPNPTTGRPPATPSPTPAPVVVPPPPPAPVLSPPATTQAQTPAAAAPAPMPASESPATKVPPRPAPFPTARNASVNPATLVAPPPALSPVWTRVLACQEQIVDKVRSDPAQLVLVRFDAAEISTTTVRGTAVNVFENDRRLSYRCTGAEATVSFLQPAPRSATSLADFSFEEVKACHAAVTTLIKRDARNADPSFETAGMMPTDTALAIRGGGVDRSRSGQPQSFRYQCHWDVDHIAGASYRFADR
ncbi:MAG: hypothetical protein ACM4AI_17195 [Acidobacteriota bacterium]